MHECSPLRFFSIFAFCLLPLRRRSGQAFAFCLFLRTLPLGLPAIPIPETNPLTLEKIALGRRLFFDRRLSPNDTMSCAMCHIPTQGFTVNETRLAVGMNGQSTKRNPPTIYNVAYLHVLFLDGREFTLEDQIITPLTNPVEMANPSMGYVVNKLRQLPGYEEQFQQTFGEGISVATLGKAIASYERTLLSANSSFDHWYFGKDANAISDEAKLGFKIFSGKGQCITCHTITKEAALFTNQGFHNTGIRSSPAYSRKDHRCRFRRWTYSEDATHASG